MKPHATLENWIRQEVIPLSFDSSAHFQAGVAQMLAALGDSMEVLGFGEALHGGEDILALRNRLFQCLVEAHGFSAIAVESSFPRGRVVNEYAAGRGPEAYEAVQETGFSHGFGKLAANRELVGWMRTCNANPDRRIKLRFYGFDSPTEFGPADSPRQTLHFVLDYLAAIDGPCAQKHRDIIAPLLGPDSAWENPAALMDPAQSIGLSPEATALRIATEDLISELRVRRPEWVAKSDEERYGEVAQYAAVAQQLLNYHAVLARNSSDRIILGLGLRDAMMADNLAYISNRERGRGKVLAFAHNSHLKCGQAQWQLGPNNLLWWPAGAHLRERLGSRYTVIGSAVGVSDANGIGAPEVGTLEARLTATPGPVRFIPTHQAQGLPAAEIAALPTRSGSMKNQSYFPLIPQSFADFDGLAVLDSTAYSRGGPPLPP